MSLSARLENHFDAETRRAHSKRNLRLGFAHTLEDVRAFQRLRHKVFVEEMGARPALPEPGIESDRYDPYCQHLLVWDNTIGMVVGGYRLLTDDIAARAGGFYSENEFDLIRLLNVPGRRIEVGRTCVHPDYRNGAVITLLWSGLARFMMMHRYDQLMGCASLSLAQGVEPIRALWRSLARTHLAPPEQRVFPLMPLPLNSKAAPEASTPAIEMPPLLKGYLRVGAKVCAEPAWDPVFNTADFFLLLSLDQMNTRYARHFTRRA